jgi:hypothetical protein
MTDSSSASRDINSIQEDQFYFDAYCGTEGTPFDFLFPNGKLVPITLKQGITLKERKALTDKSIKLNVNGKSGKISIKDVDEELFVQQLLELSVLAWPFKNRDGSAVPINSQTLANLPSTVVEKIVQVVMGITEEQLAANSPFETPSDQA